MPLPHIDIEHLLLTNEAPSETEASSLSTLVADYDVKLLKINQKISDLEEHIQVLKTEKNHLLNTVAPLKIALAPIRRLPEDIIRLIFIACIHPDINPTMSKNHPPMLLTRICRPMRRIALSTPALWASIEIPQVTRVGPDVDVKAVTQAVNAWLRRSGTLPLSISFAEFTHGPVHADDYIKLVDTIISYSSRWQDISLAISSTSTLSQFAMVKPAQAPLVRSLKFRHDDPNIIWNNNILKALSLCHAPMLEKIGLRASDIVLRSLLITQDPGIPYGNITHLSFHSTGRTNAADFLAEVLRQCHRLTSLDIATLATARFPSKEILLSSLMSLRAYEQVGDFGSQCSGLLGAIKATGLTTLHYSIVNYDPNLSPLNLMPLIKRADNLINLTLEGIPSANWLPHYLEYCHNLQSLDVRISGPFKHPEDPDITSFLSKFVLDDVSACLCPRVEFFRFLSTKNCTASGKSIQDLIERKMGNVNHLKKWQHLDLSICCDKNDQQMIEALKTHGDWLTLHIQYIKPGLQKSPIFVNHSNAFYSGAATNKVFPRLSIWPNQA